MSSKKFLTILSLIALVACNKESKPVFGVDSGLIQGQWLLVEVIGADGKPQTANEDGVFGVGSPAAQITITSIDKDKVIFERSNAPIQISIYAIDGQDIVMQDGSRNTVTTLDNQRLEFSSGSKYRRLSAEKYASLKATIAAGPQKPIDDYSDISKNILVAKIKKDSTNVTDIKSYSYESSKLQFTNCLEFKDKTLQVDGTELFSPESTAKSLVSLKIPGNLWIGLDASAENVELKKVPASHKDPVTGLTKSNEIVYAYDQATEDDDSEKNFIVMDEKGSCDWKISLKDRKLNASFSCGKLSKIVSNGYEKYGSLTGVITCTIQSDVELGNNN